MNKLGSKMKISSWIVFATLAGLVLLLTPISRTGYSQFIPIPPPGGNTQYQNIENVTQSQSGPTITNPPTIDFVTQTLKQGKNVFSVKVTGSAPIQLVQIKLATGGKIVAIKMPQEGTDIYKMLVDAEPPSKVIVIRAFDVNGRYAEAVKQFDVQQSSDVIGSIKNFFGGLFSR